MVGFPKFLNTKADYEFVRANFPREKWEHLFQEMLDTTKEWFYVKELAQGEIGLSDDTHKIIVEHSEMSADGESHSYQYELRENPDCLMARMGYAEEEVRAILEA